jgi:ABC-type amino acid transport substrate-binding protein
MKCDGKPAFPLLPGLLAARLFAAGMLLAIGAALPVHAETGDTLSTVRARGLLRCGVSLGIEGFSTKGPDRQWHGLDVDFCRAMAAAVLGDPQTVKFIPLSAPQRFPALQTQSIDILARNTTWTVAREANVSVVFIGVTYYDSEGLLVRTTLPDAAGDSLDGLRVCVESDTDQMGGGATMVGDSANIVACGICARAGLRVTFIRFLKVGLPISLAQLAATLIYNAVLSRIL